MVQALEKYNIEKDIAAFIKKEFDRKYNPTWHCIVGRNFGENLLSQCCTGSSWAVPAGRRSAEQLCCTPGAHCRASVSKPHLASWGHHSVGLWQESTCMLCSTAL